MCQLVEDSVLEDLEQSYFSQSNIQSPANDILKGLMVYIEKASAQGYNIKILESLKDKNNGKVGVVINLRLNQCFYDLVIEIEIDVTFKKLHCRASFLQHQRYVIVQSSQKRKMICRKLIKINNEIQNYGLKFIQNMETGKLMILTINDESSIFMQKDFLWLKIKAQIKIIGEVYKKYSTEIFKILNKEKYKQICLRNNGSQELKKIKNEELSYTKLCKQLQVSHVNFGFSCKPEEASFPTLQKSQSHISQLKECMYNNTDFFFQKRSRQLFCTNFQQYLDVPFQNINYQIQYNQSKMYTSYLKTPVPKDPNPGENKFILNQIQIVKPQNVKFQDTHLVGGNSKIMVTKLSFFYCQSVNVSKKITSKKSSTKNQNDYRFPFFFQAPNNSENQQKKATSLHDRQSQMMLTKMIGLKLSKKNSKQNWIHKNLNETNIIKIMKSGVSAYILKYYLSRQAHFQYSNYLLMDYLPNTQPLSNYLQIFTHTLSLNSKSFLLVNIANSLRFINDYRIVHMDLGLNNILVYRDYLVKLIDFGQAYSRNVEQSDGKYLKRGYTFPFCSPEFFQRKNDFTIKQDVFSFAVIAWRIIFNDYMFFPSQKAVRSYKEKSYFNKIFLAPQRGEAYANQQTIYLIYKILFKSICTDQVLRCQPSWLTIFFKIIYFYFL